MKTVIYRGPGHVLRAGNQTLQRGQAAAISDDLYRRLLRDPSMTLELVEPEPESPPPRRPVTTPLSGEEESD